MKKLLIYSSVFILFTTILLSGCVKNSDNSSKEDSLVLLNEASESYDNAPIRNKKECITTVYENSESNTYYDWYYDANRQIVKYTYRNDDGVSRDTFYTLENDIEYVYEQEYDESWTKNLADDASGSYQMNIPTSFSFQNDENCTYSDFEFLNSCYENIDNKECIKIAVSYVKQLKKNYTITFDSYLQQNGWKAEYVTAIEDMENLISTYIDAYHEHGEELQKEGVKIVDTIWITKDNHTLSKRLYTYKTSEKEKQVYAALEKLMNESWKIESLIENIENGMSINDAKENLTKPDYSSDLSISIPYEYEYLIYYNVDKNYNDIINLPPTI